MLTMHFRHVWFKLNTLKSDTASKSNEGNHDSGGNQKNVIQGQTPDIENSNTQQRTWSNQINMYRVSKVNEQLRLH